MAAESDSFLFDAALRAIASKGIGQVQLRDIAGEAGMSLLSLYDRMPGRTDLALFLSEEIDRSMVSAAEESDPASSIRDRLFELLMLRFDRLMPLKDALRQLGRPAGSREAGAVLTDLPGVLCSLRRSMGLALELAGASTSGIAGQVRMSALTLIYLATFRKWLSDDSPDLGATMKTLDQQLARAERWATRIP